MKSVEFCYWLQGYFEIHGDRKDNALNHEQVECVRAHLAMVFTHEIDPSYPREQQEKLNQQHASPQSPKIGGQGPDGIIFRC